MSSISSWGGASTPTPMGRAESVSMVSKSRPPTARPQTAMSTRAEGNFVIAILESRGIGREVGIASLDKETGKVGLVQVADVQTYFKTLHYIQLHYPSVVVMPDTSVPGERLSFKKQTPSLLLQYIENEFPNVTIEPLSRKFWNESAGLEFVNQLCVDDKDRAGTLVAVSNKYYALSAACGLFKYAENKLNTRYSFRSLKIKYAPVDGTMLIDSETARNLELVANITHRKSTHTLLGILNKTFTPMGTRLLRMNLLAPHSSHSHIEERLDAVDELVKLDDRFQNVKDALKLLAKEDLDKLIGGLVASEAREVSTAKSAFARITQMLNLRNLIRVVPMIHDALVGSKTPMLREIAEICQDERFAELDELISESLNDETIPKTGGGLNAVNSRVYAVKAEHNKLLDVARETYKENVGDIMQLKTELSEQYDLPLELSYVESGYVFSIRKADLQGELPSEFGNRSTRGQRMTFSNIQLKKRNARMKDALDEALILSEQIIRKLVASVVAEVGALYMLSEKIALLDMLWSFAHVTILNSYVRPEFTGTLAIKAGRHPILEKIEAAGTIVPNDAYASSASTFQIVQGPNMCTGKSTYLRQIALLTIMAMCGSFVPAEYASFKVHDSLLTRLSNDDDMEKSLSTFANEMSSTAMILGNATADSLIIIDELGRGTSPTEGFGISYAIAEELVHLKSFVFFATHFKEISTTLTRFPNVVNLHLSVKKGRRSASNIGMTFQYKIMDGVSEEHKHYGLELARLADLPPSILEDAEQIAYELSAKEEQAQKRSLTDKVFQRRRIMLRLRTQLIQARDHSTLPEKDLADFLLRLQQNTVKALAETLDDPSEEMEEE
ncbi:hypothetical protein SISNIDRAFT_551573 [Sistotremastrum niveocremeum HHB9708]|uniref:DNA mismatch repair protein MSH3 n=1 Tax=Sistotremastrum niveocremeum HHB9708 TaxID=1314777 RepID=A0A164R4F7_9AGAM|nr:hypothetical protein SISNIDRAFT_551573 [Sistotremastrum niveocremeum HHB9708]